MQAITVTLFQNESEHGTMSEVIIEKKQNENQITVKEDKLQVMIID